MRRTAIVSLASVLALWFMCSVAGAANFFEEKLQVVDNEYEDEVFGGNNQTQLIVTFIPGDDLTHEAGEPAGVDGDWFIIIDMDDDGDFNDDGVVSSGDASSGVAVTYNLDRSTLSGLPDGEYELAVIIDNIANGALDWEGEVTSETQTLSLLFRINDEYQITLVDFIKDLDERTLSAGLQQEFLANAISLSVSVDVVTPGSEWIINDASRELIVTRGDFGGDPEEDDLSVDILPATNLKWFDIDESIFDHLDEGTITGPLWETISGSLGEIRVRVDRILVVTPGEEWEMTDGVWGYSLTKNGANLDIEVNGFPGFTINNVAQDIIDALDDRYLSRELWEEFRDSGLSHLLRFPFSEDSDERVTWVITDIGGIRDYVYVVKFDDEGEFEPGDNNQDELEIYSENVLLFVVRTGSGHNSNLLDMNIIPQDLRQEFMDRGTSLAVDATVSVEDPGNEWIITGSSYTVKKEDTKLNVYSGVITGGVVTEDADSDEEEFVLDTTLEITAVDVDPDRFSPNGDGVRDITTIHYTLSESLFGSGQGVVITIGASNVSGAVQLSSPAKPTPGIQAGHNAVVWNGKDGLGNYVDDGIYNVEIEAWDKAGNEVEAPVIQVEVTTGLPEVASWGPTLPFVSTLTEVSAQLQDNSDEGIDLDASEIWVENPSGVKMAGEQQNDGPTTIKYLISTPLPGDGSADGVYTIVVTVVDKLGNSETIEHTFFYDTLFPQVTSITPADDAILTTPPSQIVIVIADGSGSGSNLHATAQTVEVEGSIIPGYTIHNGIDTITFIPFDELDEGQYTVFLSPTDFAGNVPSQPMSFQFTVGEPDDVLPQVISTDPADRDFVNLITQVSAELWDNSGKGIDFDLSTISLTGPGGLVPGVQTDNGSNTIRWELTGSLATDGSADGAYTIDIDIIDKDGGTTEETINFVYDTQVPDLISVTPADESVLTIAPDQVVMVVSDGTGSGVNFATSKTSMTLSGVQDIIREDNGFDTMTFSFDAPEDNGEYVVQITLSDKAENQHTYQSKFDFVDEPANVLPELASVDPEEWEFVNALSQVTAELRDNSGKGIDLELSTVRLVSSGGVEVAGMQKDDENVTITWELTSPLPTDGSADGTYTINVDAVDKDGGMNTFASTFVYDTQVSTIVSITPADNSVLTTAPDQVVIVVSDGTGSGVDFAFSKDSMSLSGISNIVREDNGIDTITFSFDAPEDTGEYTVTIILKDNAGNQQTYQSDFEFVEEVANVLPEVGLVDPAERSSVNALSQVSADLIDNSEKGIDLNLSTISLTGPNGIVAGIQTDDENDTITLELTSPLPTDGSADGTYTIDISAVDKTGGTTAYSSTFVYDTQVPSIISITPADESVLTEAPSQVVVVVSDGAGSGVDFAFSKDSMSLSGVSNIVREDNGLDSMTFSFDAPEDVGEYTITITLKDNAGNQQTYQSEFEFVEEIANVLPEVGSVDPAERSSINALTQVLADLIDNSEKGIDLDLSTIRLVAPDGTEMAGIQTDDENDTIVWELASPLPTDGSADGTYTINVNMVDKTGGASVYSSTFVYDTQVPTITSIMPADGSVLTEAPDQVVIVVSDGAGSGVDFASSRDSMTLSGVSDIVREDDGVETMTFSFAAIEDTATYTVTITLRDNAGNQQTYQSEFDFVEKPEDLLPEVASVDPYERALVNSISQVSAVLRDNSGEGIDLNLSTISLTGPGEIAVNGIQTDNDNDTITWELTSPLPTDGSADGTYTINVSAVDKSGGTTTYSSTFVYDTQVPTITSITPADGSILTEAPTQVVIVISDGDGSGVNFADSRDSMSLSGVSNISREDNGVDTMTFSFAAPEGIGGYTVTITLSDGAGNQQTYQSEFDLVEKSTDLLPELSSVDPAERSFVNALLQVSATLTDNSGKGIDLSASTIKLEDPAGVEVTGVQTDNEQSTITLELPAPLPTDGSVDGTYTIKISAMDKAGGASAFISTFLYDSLSPSVIATTPAANDVFYEGISQVTAQFDDGDGSGVDMEQTGVSVRGPGGSIEADKGDNGKDTMTLDFSMLTDSGNYTIEISPRDRAGNAGYPVEIKFSYVLKPPAIVSVSLTNRAYVSSLDSIEAVLEDRSGIGLDLSETGSSIVVTGPGGELQADQTNNDVDTIIWQPVHSLATDGTDDGTYTVTVTPMDTVGAVGQSRQYTVIYDTQPPEVISASPVDINADITHVGEQLIGVQAQIRDEGPADIEVQDQAIYLEAADGTQIPGVQTDDNNDTVTWNLADPLAKDGSADGIYTVVVIATDRAGAQKEFRYQLIYDTVRPQVGGTTPTDNDMLRSNISSVSADLDDSGAGEIDFQRSWIELRTPSGGSVSGTVSNDADETIIFDFTGLEEHGTYTILVTAVDKAGNGADIQWKSEFVFETGLPVIFSTVPVTDSSEQAYLNTELTSVRATLRSTDSGGIDLSPTGSRIRLRGPDGNFIIGTKSNSGVNTLVFTLGRPRNTDGTEDGTYTMLVTAVNGTGRRDEERSRSFIYDTQEPEVTWISHLNVNAEESYLHDRITEIEARLADEGPAGVDVDRSSMRLVDPDGQTVDTASSNDGADTIKLEFPAGLSKEGLYQLALNAMDRAGNMLQENVRFVYSVSLPEIVATEPVTTPAELAYVNTKLTTVEAELRETGSGGIDFSDTGSTIELRGPKGDVRGVQSNDGNILIFTLTVPLATDGADDGQYTISVTPSNAAKLKAQTAEFRFTYDTVAPEVDKDDIELWSAGEAGSSLTEISAIVTDLQPGSGVDWKNFDNRWIELQDSSGGEVSGAVRVSPEESKVSLLLDIPLASNGSQDGFYTVVVAPEDIAGNATSPAVQYEFLYDTRPPTVKKAEITINEKILLLDSSLEEYPTAVNTKNGVTITAIMEDDGVGVDLTKSSIRITGPGGEVSGSLRQDGLDTIWLTTGMLNDEGIYNVEINPVDLSGNGTEKSSETISTEFLFEETAPTASLTEPATNEKAEDEPITLKGTAVDTLGREGEDNLASGVVKVEIGGIGPGGVALDWILAEDDSDANEEPWSEWSLDFLPVASGTYKIEIRVWDEAGNSETYATDIELEFDISLAFQGEAYCWPNPVINGVAHISFEINIPGGGSAPVILYVYDVSGGLVYEKEHIEIPSTSRTSVEWDCTNAAGEKVVTGIYVFRLEAEIDGEVANIVGKPMIIKR